ncbi:MAG: DEAD/DEAH box helicase [Acidimicrobiales bacterium]|jgi:superfamily II DNA/RNA helicase|nr:DEAD/DEAH box helicase [Acidimicrobiales bacterium]|tara:strand:+ start:1494 stop:2981 length:1488 start_codon:yes stop_codon:yes gene_type:complete
MSPTFSDLGVPGRICEALERRGITEPFEIQAATIADAMSGRDVCGRAPTGSGKTLAFGIPLVADVQRAAPREPRALVLAPTRELAEQISTELRSFAGKVSIGVVYGGVGYGPQLNALRRGVDILVACPGRLEDLIEQGALSLASVDRVVLDEADRMADMGFMPAVRRLLDQTNPDRQTVLFSATLDGDVARLTRDYQRDPVGHEVGEETPDITTASHVFWNATQADRREITADAVGAAWPAIIFCRTRHGSDRLARQLSREGLKTAAIHGGRSQAQRTRALADFARGRVHALVATDVAARGIHVDGVASVIHFDPPEDHKAYVHRSGRTARAGETGVVVSLVQPNQVRDTKRMQRQIGLDEPLTEPDAAVLRHLSPVPARNVRDVVTEGNSSAGEGNGRSSDTAGRGRGQGHRSGNGSAGRSHNGSGNNRSGNNGSGNNRSGNKSRNRRRGSNGNAGKPGNKKGSGGNKRGRHPADSSNGGNRKARRAHLQRTRG